MEVLHKHVMRDQLGNTNTASKSTTSFCQPRTPNQHSTIE
jgi:hypothetical protein